MEEVEQIEARWSAMLKQQHLAFLKESEDRARRHHLIFQLFRDQQQESHRKLQQRISRDIEQMKQRAKERAEAWQHHAVLQEQKELRQEVSCIRGEQDQLQQAVQDLEQQTQEGFARIQQQLQQLETLRDIAGMEKQQEEELAAVQQQGNQLHDSSAQNKQQLQQLGKNIAGMEKQKKQQEEELAENKHQAEQVDEGNGDFNTRLQYVERSLHYAECHGLRL